VDFKDQHQSASRGLNPAKLKQLIEIEMKWETRPRNNRPKVKYKYEGMNSEQIYEKSISGD